MSKNILFVVPHLNVGGMIVSLQSLLYELASDDVTIHIFARDASGIYKNKLPNCIILDENIWLSTHLYNCGRLKKTTHLLLKIIRKLTSLLGINIDRCYFKFGGKGIHSESYNAVISYQENLTRFVCYMPAKKRIAWIHCDYSRYKSLFPKKEDKYFALYDNVICVSKYTRMTFCSSVCYNPQNVIWLHNIINAHLIIEKSNAVYDLDPLFDNSFYTIVSIGRLDPVKQFDMIPKIASRLKQISSVAFRWYIIGGRRGNWELEQQIESEIAELGLSDTVICLSEKSNVYPYLKGSDLYVCTSLSEAYPMAINEAKVLGKPIVTNNFGSVNEVVDDNIDGYITSLNEMPDVINKMMNSGLALRRNLVDNLIEENHKEKDKLLALI